MGSFVSMAIQRHAADGLTQCKLEALRDLAHAWQAARTRYISDYWPIAYAGRVLGSPRAIRDERRQRGWAVIDMPVAHHQTALMSALGVLRGSWNVARRRVRDRIARDRRFTPAEKRWLRRVLSDPRLLQHCLGGGVVELDEIWSAGLGEVLSQQLRRMVLRARPPRPRPERGLWIELDSELYRPFHRPRDPHFRGSWVAVTSREAGSRIHVPLAGPLPLLSVAVGAVPHCPTIRLDVTERPVFSFRARIPRPAVEPGADIGIDKGYLTLLTVSDGSTETARAYGAGGDAAVAEIAASDHARRGQRRRIAWHATSLRRTDPAKSRRIQRNNFGTRRVQRRAKRERARLRNEIDRALNALFRLEAPLKRIFAERLDIRARSLSRGSNRRLGRWSNGYMHRRLAYKAELNGVELVVVNAAYTSQTCPACWFTSGSNRRRERFKCVQCGFTGSADAVAATNVLARGRDPAISRFISRVELKQILDERWRSARSGRAWGSNDAAVLIPDDGQELQLAGAANNWSSDQSTSAKPDRGVVL